MVFQNLLMQCGQWISQGQGVRELPPLHFHVRGAGGTSQTLRINPSSYIMQRSNGVVTACQALFSPMVMNTQLNGPVWIFGSPLFYEFEVTYDIVARPPGISFSNTGCGSCRQGQVSTVIMSDGEASSSGQGTNQPREVNG